MTGNGTDYDITVRDAEWLSAVSLLPIDIRRLSLRKFRAIYGDAAVIEAFAQFMGLASSVAANSAEMCSMQRTIDGAEHPDRPEDRVNMPTIFGALQGAILAADVDTPSRCSTCAYRLGTIANQSPMTTRVADWCGHPDEEAFMCHEDMDGDEPTRACAGWAELRKARREATQ